jgi:hypothetical protein
MTGPGKFGSAINLVGTYLIVDGGPRQPCMVCRFVKLSSTSNPRQRTRTLSVFHGVGSIHYISSSISAQ